MVDVGIRVQQSCAHVPDIELVEDEIFQRLLQMRFADEGRPDHFPVR